MIEVKNVYKKFNNLKVLDNISATFQQGKTNLIIGQSGSGKTVLLKLIVGLHILNEGQIIYSGKEYSNMNATQKKEIRKQMGMVFQGGALFSSSTVEENVAFPLNMFTRKSKEEIKERVNFCLNRVDIIDKNHLYPSEISGGMQKRVAIARSIALNPRYLFCDEPNSGLDPLTAIVIDNLIKEITEEFNITTIINTHDMNSVMEIGQKVLFIYKGRKAWEGTKEEILKSDNKELNNFVFANKSFQLVKRKK